MTTSNDWSVIAYPVLFACLADKLAAIFGNDAETGTLAAVEMLTEGFVAELSPELGF